VFLGYIISSRGVKVDEEKIEVIRDWPKPASIADVRSFHENPHPTNIDSRTRSIRMMPRRQLFFDKSFFNSLENHGREIISPTHTHAHT
jgi:hypothetical protein